MEEGFNPHVFDDLDVPGQEEEREKMWEWRRKVWAECCELGPGHIFVFDIARRGGKTRMAHHIASKGFYDNTRVVTVHANMQSVHAFVKLGDFDQTFVPTTSPQGLLADIIIVDDIADDVFYKSIVPMLQMTNATLFVFGTNINQGIKDVADYTANVLCDPSVDHRRLLFEKPDRWLSPQQTEPLKQLYADPVVATREFTVEATDLAEQLAVTLVLKLLPNTDLREANGLDPAKFKRSVCTDKDTPENRVKLLACVEPGTTVAFVVDAQGKLFMFSH